MKPEFGIQEEHFNFEHRVIVVDTKEAKYQGHSWQTLSEFYKRKFDNLLRLQYPKERVKINYI